MLQVDLVHEIDRLLQEGTLSQRQVAARLGVSRGTVDAIASGRRRLYGKESRGDAYTYHAATSTRCASCGYRVYPPCLICSTRAHRDRELRLRRTRTGAACENHCKS